MAHFAELDSNNKVIKVVVLRNEDTVDSNGNELESVGVELLQNMFGSDTIWKQTSYNGNFRKRYASPEFTYDVVNDCFIPPKPYPSWTFNTTTKNWEPPLVEPDRTDDMISNNQGWVWSEDVYQANNTSGWIVSSNI